MPPSDFWKLTPQEFYLVWDTRRPRDPTIDFAGTLTEQRCKELEALARKMTQQP